jgi:hypothetical protein
LTSEGQKIRVIGIDTIGLGVLGFIAVYFQSIAGYAKIWDRRVSNNKRFLFPFLIGVFFGLLDLVIVEMVLPHPPHTSLPPYTQPFPYSLLLYPSGAMYVELLYRFLPLTLVGVLASSLTTKRNSNLIFFLFAVLTSLIEPFSQLPDGATWFLVYSVLSGFVFNVLQALYLRNAGFLAALTIRLGHYFIWHILLGMYIQYVLL